MPLIGSNTKTPAAAITSAADGGTTLLANLSNLQTLTGVTMGALEVFNSNMPTWADWENPWFANDPSQGYTNWVAGDPANRQLIVSCMLIPTVAGSMSDPLTWETAGAGGAYNTHATALATNLVNAGLGSSIIRLGLEANGNWNIDSIGGSAPGGGTAAMRTAWAQTWQQEVTAMRAVAGANFKFCWCPNAVVAGVPFADYYPGDAYVDIIGIDTYDAFANGTQPAPSAATTTALFAQAYGLTDITSFAVAHGKPLGLGEWGTQLGGANGGLGDDPYYVQGIGNWVAANQVAFHCYFDTGSDNIIPLSSSYPLTLNAYKSAFAPGGAPVVTTGTASGVTSSAATLNGTVNPKGASTTYQFEYGLTTNYGTAVPAAPGPAGSGSAAVAESYSLIGLAATATYHYRLNATNASGTTHGPDQSFTTTAAGGIVPFTVSASIDNFNDGGAFKVFVVTGATAAGGHSATLQAFDPGPANVSLNPIGSGSLLLWGIFTRATATLTAAANNSNSNTGAIGSLYEYADGRYTGTVTAGSAVTAGSSTSVANWNDIVAYELRSSGTPAIDASSPAAVTGTTSPLTSGTFTPPAGAVLVAVIMTSTFGTAASTITITDTSGLGLTWTQRAVVPQTGFSYAGVAAIYTATLSTPVQLGGTAALSGTGTLSAAGVLAGTAALSGSGTLTGTPTHLTAHGHGTAALSGTGTLSAAWTGFLIQAALLSGIGTLSGTGTGILQQPPVTLSGIGNIQLSGVILGVATGLAGNGTLSVLQATGGLVFASPGAATPYAYPLSSQVMVAPPGTQAWVPLGSLGVVTALTYSYTCPGGADQMTATVMLPAAYRTQNFNPGWAVKITRGGHQVWSGKLDEPQPTAQGWTLTASGAGTRGQDYLAIYSSAWPSGQPDVSINAAISRGLPWQNPGVGTPAGAWFGQAVDSGAQTISALLTLICTRGGLTWMVSSQPGGVPGDDLSVFPLPATPNRLLTCTQPVPRTLGGDVNTIYLRYQVSADDPSGSGAAAVFGTTSVQNAASVAAHGELETFIDISDVGTMTAGAAQAVGSQALAVYQRASFAGPFTGHYGQLTTVGGVPIDPGTDQAGTMVRPILVDYGYGGEVTPQFPVQFVVGAYEWNDLTQEFTATPYVNVDQSLTGLLSLANTELTPITVASA